jgi:hypothetical protein
MVLVPRHSLLPTVVAFLLAPTLAFGAGVQALFDLSTTTGGPFPSDGSPPPITVKSRASG